MKFEAPTSIDAAVSLLAEPGARCLAGGQSLMAMLNAQLIEPELLVSLRRIDALRAVAPLPGGGLRIGAMVTHRAIAELAGDDAAVELSRLAARLIAHPAIRNQGTMGGSICHADPAGDFPTVVACAEATIRVAHAGGIREVAACDFFRGYFETAVREGELVVAIDLPESPRGARAHYEKFMLTEGDFAVASVAAIVGWRKGRCSHARIAVGACASRPVRLLEAESLLLESRLEEDTVQRAGELLAAACDPIDDFRASGRYRLRLVPKLVRRAVLAAKTRAERADG